MVTYASKTDAGSREVNEDSVGVYEKDGRYCFVLCDGLGGHGRGEVASALVVEEIGKCFMESESNEELLRQSFLRAQNRLTEKQRAEHATDKMKTTVTAVLIDSESIRIGHIGDSRVYYFRHGFLMKRTQDHSVPQMLVLSGEIKEKDIRHHPDRNRLLRVMGSPWNGEPFELQKPYKNRNGTALLLCSDGFWELIDEAMMKKLLRHSKTPTEWLDKMTEVVTESGKNTEMDNYSAITVWITPK